MGARALDSWISTCWWYSEPTDAIRCKDERKTLEMNVSDRVLDSKKGISKNIIRASSTMCLNLVTRCGFGSKIIDFEQKHWKTKENQ